MFRNKSEGSKETSENSEITTTTTTTASEEKTTDDLKKPDKILPCPRCKSSDTKFCYYNNYNVTQPRHFCRSCQRYWTSGGSMRTVPVGSGQNKGWVSSDHYMHIKSENTTTTTMTPRRKFLASILRATSLWLPRMTQQFNIVVNGSETKSISNRFVSETYLNLQANPAAMSRSMNSGEHVTLKRFQLSVVPPLVRLPHRVLSSPEESVDWLDY
ncbi:hypothetical protein F2Q68_00014282 [Brassica cretica]|uniref:Dof-type domain-containing protein n=1 Tax=Brassica cretica TaxID=69181 RepID=A0A8S9HHE7_BRACR|nr:hypothetical protein F2Q68_00014282 [Brassica cretica]